MPWQVHLNVCWPPQPPPTPTPAPEPTLLQVTLIGTGEGAEGALPPRPLVTMPSCHYAFWSCLYIVPI